MSKTIFVKAAEENNISVVNEYVSNNKHIEGFEYILALESAVENGRVEIVKTILNYPYISPNEADNYIFRYSCKFGHTKVIKALLNDYRIDPSASENRALKTALHYKYFEVVKLLLKDKRVLKSLSGKCTHNKYIFNILKSQFNTNSLYEIKKILKFI